MSALCYTANPAAVTLSRPTARLVSSMQQAPVITRESITAAILTGGRARRRTGQRKGLAWIAGRARPQEQRVAAG